MIEQYFSRFAFELVCCLLAALRFLFVLYFPAYLTCRVLHIWYLSQGLRNLSAVMQVAILHCQISCFSFSKDVSVLWIFSDSQVCCLVLGTYFYQISFISNWICSRTCLAQLSISGRSFSLSLIKFIFTILQCKDSEIRRWNRIKKGEDDGRKGSKEEKEISERYC